MADADEFREFGKGPVSVAWSTVWVSFSGPLRSRLASNSGQARAEVLASTFRHGGGLSRMETDTRGVLLPLTGVGGGIARKTGNFYPVDAP